MASCAVENPKLGHIGPSKPSIQKSISLAINSNYIDLNNDNSQYSINFPFSIDVSLNQLGFPFDTNSEIKPSPGIVDFDNDGNNEIIFGDNFGLIHIFNL